MIRVVGGEVDWMEAAAHSDGGGGAPDEQIFSQILPRRIGAGFRACHLGSRTGPTQLIANRAMGGDGDCHTRTLDGVGHCPSAHFRRSH